MSNPTNLPAYYLMSLEDLKAAFQAWARELKFADPNKPAPSTHEELYTKPELKRLLGVTSDATIWLYLRDGKLPPPIKMGKKSLWVKSQIDQLIQNHSTQFRIKR